MIILDPSVGVKQLTNLDFNLLSKLITLMLETNHKQRINITAKIHKSRIKGTSLCQHVNGREFLINLDTSNTKKRYLISSILHEVRHCIQKNIFGYWPDTHNMKTWRDYWYSKEEIDARKMEKLTTQMIKSYDSMVKMSEQFKELNLNKIG
tara:strand:+ start:94 stop:546 length:453 start_codon:yes stop_codon:yes gene_type:complete